MCNGPVIVDKSIVKKIRNVHVFPLEKVLHDMERKMFCCFCEIDKFLCLRYLSDWEYEQGSYDDDVGAYVNDRSSNYADDVCVKL